MVTVYFKNLVQVTDADCLNQTISQNEILCSISSLNSNRDSGPDGICVEMFKHSIGITLRYIHQLFNEIFFTGQFPSEWSVSVITPVHKKGSKSDPNNYRAISLINSLSKIFTTILTTRLTK